MQDKTYGSIVIYTALSLTLTAGSGHQGGIHPDDMPHKHHPLERVQQQKLAMQSTSYAQPTTLLAIKQDFTYWTIK